MALAKLHKTVLSILEGQERKTLCSINEEGRNLTSTLPPSSMAVEKVLQEVLKRDQQSKREQRSESSTQELFDILLKMLKENANWGIATLSGAQKEGQATGLATTGPGAPAVMLALTYGSVDWTCWLASHLERVVALFLAASEIITYLFLTAVIVYVSVRVYQWRRDRKVRQRQEVFELVEQILSLLVTQHQAAARTPPDVISRPTSWVAVNHVRDQLIPPQARTGRRSAWALAVSDLRAPESKIREAVHPIYRVDPRVCP